MKPKITVIGSINVDLITKVNQWPKPGETMTADAFLQMHGGKGGNQAVASARLGADAVMLGCVGEDSFGQEAVDHLKNENVRVDHVGRIPGAHTGLAFITLAENDNQIIVAPGANYACTPDWIVNHEEVIAESDVILMQMEIPLPTVAKAAEIARKHGVKVILNPAPFQLIDKTLLALVDVLTPNEHEYAQLKPSLSDFTGDLIVTRGDKGVAFIKNDQEIVKPGYQVEVVDTTGAGDTFNGALAAKWAETGSLEAAIDFAIVASALSVTKSGAQGGMPTLKDIHAFTETRRTRE
ncbi:MAG TPA: ribokinase [Bacillales bacterium]|nr:ribokinase [Bacillales bacterium]